jgi:murein DD-endopeptidase MepM/ murein hydrolase activator NlpD
LANTEQPITNLPKKGMLWLHFVSISILGMVILGAILVKYHLNVIASTQKATQIVQVKTVPTLPAPVISPELKTIQVAIRSNDSLASVFKRMRFSNNDARQILSMKVAKSLLNLRQGQKIGFVVNPVDRSFKQLTFSADGVDSLTIAKSHDFQAKAIHYEPVQHLQYVSSTVRGSIYSAGKKVGLPGKVIQQFARVFNNKGSFAHGIYNGDKFAVYYREFLVGNKKVRDGDIAAAELIHAGKAYRVLGFTEPSGNTNFYTPQGYSLIPPFLRYPVRYTRIGSRFSFARLEPILGIVRPHLGVDLVAPAGTPIKASSNGKIAFIGRKGGYGKAIIVQRGKYTTLYAHMSRFKTGLHYGSSVKQGDTIGFVGATGLATGPHLHYEFRINGVHYDPLKDSLPSGEMIASSYRKQFFSFARTMLAKLDMQRNVVVAMEKEDGEHSS